jgi:predicted methyltransferase
MSNAVIHPRHLRAVLEAVVKAEFSKNWQTPDLSGYNRRYTDGALAELRKTGLIETRSGYLAATERGKIFIALVIGRETKARSSRIEAAE